MFYKMLFLYFFGITSGQNMIWPSQLCKDDIKSLDVFSLSNLSGRWYQARRNHLKSPEEDSLRCIFTNYTLDDGGKFKSTASAIVGGNLMIFNGNGSVPDSTKPGKFTSTVYKDSEFIETIVFEYLDIDYESYAILFSCHQADVANVSITEIHTREQHPSELVVAKAIKVLEDKGFNVSELITTNQEDCEPK